MGVYKDCQNLCGAPNYLRNAWSYKLQIWPEHSQAHSEQKVIKILKKGAWAYPGTAQFFAYPISSQTLKAMNFKFGRNICRLNPSKRPWKKLKTRGRGRSQGLSKIFRAAINRAHRAVVFEIAQLSCQNLRYFRCPLWQTKSWWKSKPARKLKHTSSILEYFECFCQMSWKSILTILSYTVSKLVRFFWDTV